MFKTISDRITYPQWVQYDPRYKTLDLYDRLLDGTFYDELPYSFYDEKMSNGEPVALKDKRPSAQFHLPNMVARWCSRKLFAGRHVPRITHKDKATEKKVKKIAKKAHLFKHMLEAVNFGSVGSVAMTFRVDKDGDKTTNVALTIWRAKYCVPVFDDNCELDLLRVQYITSGSNLMDGGYLYDVLGNEIRPTDSYWYIRDYTRTHEITYFPIQKDDWNPVEGAKKDGVFLSPWISHIPAPEGMLPENGIVEHKLGFVPAQWFCNLSGGKSPDGACTWEPAIANSIELDYMLSQIGRGTRYNCAPQPVIKGDILNPNVTRGPTHFIHLAADKKDADGNVLGGANATLLEMSGNGIKAALELVDKLRNYALEQILAARKDPDKMKGPLSGRAMEYLDEDSHDLAMELRNQYGEDGMLPLLRKILKASDPNIDTEKLGLKWPRMYQPTPQDLQFMSQALATMIDPLGQGSIKPQAPRAAEGQAQPKQPDPIDPKPEYMIITPEEARKYMRLQMDLDMLDEEEIDDTEEDDKPAPEKKPDHPEPTSLSDGNKVEGEGLFATKVGQPVTVSA